MFVWFGTKTKVRRVQGGRIEQRDCPECNETANFVECEMTESVSVFSVVELMDSKETLFRCSYCGELFRDQDEAAETETEEQRQRRRLDALLEEAEQAKQKREMERAVAEAKAEVQLEELKVKMGLLEAPPAEPEPKQLPRRRWPWRRKRDD